MKQLFNRHIIVNAVLFQLLWFAAVIGSAKGFVWPYLLFSTLLIVWQLHPSHRHPSDLKVVAVAVVLGLIIDTLFLQFNVFKFADSFPVEGISPLWIILLWVGFALTVNHSMQWLNKHPLLPALAGAIFAPLSYLAGLRLGAVEYHIDPLLVSAFISVPWALALTILYTIANTSNQ